MRKMSSKKMHSMLHRVLIPLAVVTSSSTILAISYWYHEQQLTQQLNGQQTSRALSQLVESQIPSKTATNQTHTTRAHATTTPVGNGTANGTQTHFATAHSKPSNAKSKTKKSTRSRSALSNTSSTSANPAKKPAAKSATSKAVTTPPHSAVQGGVAKSVTNEQLTNTTIQSAVVQFGNHPQTTGLAGQLQSGWGTSLSIPKSIATNRLLAVSLHSGILWAVVPPTDMNLDGQLGMASSPTNVMYSPYPPKGSRSLTESSIVIGEIPVSTAGEKSLGLSWTHVKPQQKYVVQSPSTPSSATNNTTSNKGTNAPQSNATNTSTQLVKNNALKTGKHVFLSSLYQDDFGGVIVLDVVDASASETRLVYSFDEFNRSIREVASLPNDGTKYSWLAVSKDHLYWGIRTVNAQNPSVYRTKQFLYNLESQSTHPISLGTWTGAMYVSGDHLVYQVKNTTTWKEFIPSAKQSTKTSTKTSGNTSTGS